MQLTALWPFLLINLACFVAAWAIARGNSFYREELRILTAGRVQMIDGLRGWLSLVEYWSWAGSAALLAVVLSSITYRFVEPPFIHRSPVPVQARSTPLRASPPSPAAVGP